MTALMRRAGTRLLPTNPTLDGSVVTIANTTTYDAFPGIARLATDDLIVVYYQATDHATTQDGIIRKRTSTDDGATWSAATTIVAATGGIDKRGADVAVLSSGRVIVTFFEWDGTENDGARVPYIIYSDDDGATWSAKIQITHGFTYWGFAQSPVVELANGDLLCPMYGLDDGDSNSTRSVKVSKSTDDGATWAHLAEIADGVALAEDFGEPNIAQLNDGTLVCAIRCNRSTPSANSVLRNETHLSWSFDSGATWSIPKGKIAGTGRPAILQRPSDGLLLCQYRAPLTDDGAAYSNGLFGFRVSNDRGRTWSSSIADLTGGSTLPYEYGNWTTLASGQVCGVWALEASSTDSDLYFGKITGGS